MKCARRLLVLVVMAAPLGLCVGSPGRATADELDKKVLEIVKQVGGLYDKAKSLQVESTLTQTLEQGNEKRQVETTGKYVIERPNRFALRGQVKGDKKAGLDIISDGKKFFALAKGAQEYIEEDAPADMPEMGRKLMQFGPPNMGMLFHNVLTGDANETLMDGVTACSYAGKEKLDGTEAHHLKFTQAEFNWEMWVAAEGKPFVLKMTNNRSANDRTFNTVETYKNWKLDAPVDDKAFVFEAPKDAKKVDELRRNVDRDQAE
jgi:hypothetical protein